MINSKQRAYLKGLANTLEPIMQLGKGGIGENTIAQIDELLEAKELVKIKVLKNSPQEVDEYVEEILSGTGAEFVQCIGSKLTVYRASKDAKKRKIELPR